MRIYRLSIFFLFLLASMGLHAQTGNTTLNRAITFHADSISKTKLLDSIGQVYQIHFSYNPELLNANENISIHKIEQPLYLVLAELIDKKTLNFKALDNQVIFYPIQPNEHAEIILPYKEIKGIIREERKGKPIPYSNIGLLGKALGTMSNLNGEFSIKIPEEFIFDTISISCIGFESQYLPIDTFSEKEAIITLTKRTFHIKSVDVIRYDPELVLSKVDENISKNYEKDYTLLTTFYREIIKENEVYTDISEAILQVLKAPYQFQQREDHVKLLKGRKGAENKPLNDIRFRLKGGPYFISKLDVVKNNASFINPDFRHLYHFEYDRQILIDDRETVVLDFTPIYALRDILDEGKLYVDLETWAISRVDFNYTKQGLKEARHMLIQKEPRHCKAIPTELFYTVQYQLVDNIWFLHSLRSSMKIKINDKEKKLKTNFHSISEMLITNIEKGDFQHFTKQEIFRSNEIFTDKIESYDQLFWKDYNIILPEERLINALKNFDNQNLIITNF